MAMPIAIQMKNRIQVIPGRLNMKIRLMPAPRMGISIQDRLATAARKRASVSGFSLNTLTRQLTAKLPAGLTRGMSDWAL